MGLAQNAEQLAEQELVIAQKSRQLDWYARNAPLMILDKAGSNVPMRFNEPQMIVHNIVTKTRAARKPLRLIILKARKEGVSSYFCADFVHITQTRNNQECALMAQDQDHGAKLFEKVEHMHDNIDPYFRVERLGQNVGKRIRLVNGSNLAVMSAHKTGSGRSTTPHHLHLTELPDWPNPEKTMTGLTQAVPKASSNWFTSIVMESTAQGVGDYWYRECKKAQRGRSAYRFLFLPWFILNEYERPVDPDELRREPLTPDEETLGKFIIADMPNYGLAVPDRDAIIRKLMFRRDTIIELGFDLWNQEFPGTPEDAFLATGRPYFPRGAVKAHRLRQHPNGKLVVVESRRTCDIRESAPDADAAPEDAKTPYKLIDDESGPLLVWQEPIPDARYVIPADIASGEALDFSAAHVLRLDGHKIDQVAVWHGKITTDDFAYVLAFLGHWYNKALLVPEHNSFGKNTVVELTNRIKYPRVYRERRFDTDAQREALVYGFGTNERTRPAMLEQLHSYVRSFDLTLRHEETVDELSKFAFNKKGKPEAPNGSHDDLVMSLAMGIYARGQVGQSRVDVKNARGARY